MLLMGALLSGCAASSRGAERLPPSERATSSAESARGWLEQGLPGVMKEAEVPGLAVALIEEGEPAWIHGFGVTNTSTGAPVSEDTVFEAASLSKPVFAYAVMKLVDSGQLDLDAPLTRYVTEARVTGDSRLQHITARRVLSHTSGFPNWRPPGQPLRIHFEPGERFSYSGEGIDYLQAAVENITHLPFDEFMRRTVFAPLGMTSSSYLWQERFAPRRAYRHDAAGHVLGRPRFMEPSAASTLTTTAGDYARFVSAMLRGEGLKEATWREMVRPQVWVEEACTQCLEPKTSGKRSEVLAWGLGWGLQRDARGSFLWHWGDGGGVKAYVAADLETKRGMVVFADGANGLSLMQETLRRVMGAEHPALTWLAYEQYDSPSQRLLRDVLTRGEVALVEDRERRTRQGTPPEEAPANQLGYALLSHGRTREAINVLLRNAEDFPDSGNTHDSLGEAYVQAGEKALAVQEYRKVLALEPASGNATAMLRWLELPELAVSSSVLEKCVGTYALPVGPIRVTRDGTRLRFQLDEQPSKPMAPLSETRFLIEPGHAEIEFILSPEGKATQVALRSDGKRFDGKRTEAP